VILPEEPFAMNKPAFERVIKGLIASEPFVPFAVELHTGERILIEQPASFRCQGGAAAYAPASGELDIFDYRSVRDVEILQPANPRGQ
jgi:hypothetical protein